MTKLLFFPGGKPESLTAYGLSLDETLRESEFVHGFMTFPNDDFSAFYAATVHDKSDERLKLLGRSKPALSISPNDAEEHLRRYRQSKPELVCLIDTAFSRRMSQGLSAGSIAYYLLHLHSSGLPVSRNKAAHLSSKLAKKNLKERNLGMKTGPKRILSNFREHAHVSHYWAAHLWTKSPYFLDSFEAANPGLGTIELACWRAIIFLAWAEHFRAGLLTIPNLGASSWGMRPRLWLHCTQTYEPLGVMPEPLLEDLRDYHNPNVGPLQ